VDEINSIDGNINKDVMNRMVFEIYKNIQDAWMNFDYDTLKKYTTDELFNMYESQLKVLNAKKQKNIMSDIEFISAKIVDITIENGVEKVKMYLNTITKDYVVDSNNNVVRGSDKFKNNMEYIITLNRSIEKGNIKNCPSCGAPIDIVSGGKCPYCDSVIVNNNNEFVMSKKECISQRRV
jgi:predicted lipid-binding transport protein (Tim44 family)